MNRVFSLQPVTSLIDGQQNIAAIAGSVVIAGGVWSMLRAVLREGVQQGALAPTSV